MSRRPLTVYKASAGSGKTFTLATEYIRLLVENHHPRRDLYQQGHRGDEDAYSESTLRHLETTA